MEALRRLASFAVPALALFAASCAGAPVPTALPRLHCEVLQPLHPSGRFHSGWGTVVIDGDHPPTPAPEPPFASDREAEDQLRGWLREQFGPMPKGTDLHVVSVQQSASGGDRPRYDWDAGHTFVFAQTWRGFATDRNAVLYLQGRSKVSGSHSLARITVVPGSERTILDEATARARIAEVLQSMGRDAAEAADVPMHLHFLWSGGDEKSSELRPVWLLGDGPGYLDAVTGVPGRNG